VIVIYYIRESVLDNTRKMDYTSVNTVEEFVDWFFKLGDRVTFSLIKKNRSLTPEGWEKSPVYSANVLSAYDSHHQIAIKIIRIVSDEGILFEDIKHCSEMIVDQIALKCVIK
jgi:hypothetical protein